MRGEKWPRLRSPFFPDPHLLHQLSVINRGAFGLVILCREVASGEAIAVKLIERGHKV